MEKSFSRKPNHRHFYGSYMEKIIFFTLEGIFLPLEDSSLAKNNFFSSTNNDTFQMSNEKCRVLGNFDKK